MHDQKNFIYGPEDRRPNPKFHDQFSPLGICRWNPTFSFGIVSHWVGGVNSSLPGFRTLNSIIRNLLVRATQQDRVCRGFNVSYNMTQGGHFLENREKSEHFGNFSKSLGIFKEKRKLLDEVENPDASFVSRDAPYIRKENKK